VIYSLSSVTKVYLQGHTRVCALNGISLEVSPGEHIALLGQSGAGKSTLFRLLNGTIRPTSGTVNFEGQDVGEMSGAGLRAMRRRIGTIFQQHNLVPSLSAFENTLCGGLGRWSLAHTLRGMIRPANDDREKALAALESVGLADRRNARADELSGGQQQRVAIARTLMQDPDVILADEPVASLDPGLAAEIIALLTRLAADGKRTLLVSLHTVDLALDRFPRLIALRAGNVEFDAAPSEIDAERLKKLYASAGSSPQSTAQVKNGGGNQPEFNCVS
jgi:phosphonate transport system ATP-binding protein